MSVLASDAFSGTGALSASWTNSGTGTAFTQGSGVVKSGGGSDEYAAYTGTSWPNDQWSEITLGTPTTTAGVGAGNGPMVRQHTTIGTKTHYRFIGSGSGFELAKSVAGAFTSFASGSGTTFAVGDRAYLEVQGTSVVGKKNTTNGAGGTTVASQTDSSVASGNAGIFYSSSDADASIDSWQGGDFGGGGAAVLAPSTLTMLGVQ